MKTAVHIDDLSVYYGQTPAVAGVCLDVGERRIFRHHRAQRRREVHASQSHTGPCSRFRGDGFRIRQKSGAPGTPVGYVPQFAAMDKKFPITLMEVVLTGRLKAGLSPFYRYSKKDRLAVHGLLERVGVESLADRQISELSGGEFQKMLIARALAVSPRLLLLDEPTASVDAASCDQIYELLGELNKDMTIILVTHDLLAVSSQVKRLACMNGRLVYHGEPELSESIVNSLYGCPVDLIAHGVAPQSAEGTRGGTA